MMLGPSSENFSGLLKHITYALKPVCNSLMQLDCCDAKYKIKLNAERCTTLHFGTAVYEQVVSLLLRFTVASISCSPTGIPFSLYCFSPSYKHKMERQNKYIC